MNQGELRDIIKKYALQNAVFYNGRANPQAVLGKVLASEPGLRKHVQLVREEIERVVSEVNTLHLEEQKTLLHNIDPKLLERQEKVQVPLPGLPNAQEGKVVTRFAPAPTGPLHISHIMRAAMLSYLYAKKYSGKFIVRFEDTDAKKIDGQFYDMIKNDLHAVGIKWDEIVLESDFMDLYYKYAKKLFDKKKFYVCVCPQENFKKLKEKKKNCPCRRNSAKKNLELWKQMLAGKFREGRAVVRLKTSMKHKNPALRDPPMLRISKAPHPKKGRKFFVWPLYNFANVVADHYNRITHVFRAKEHQHNTEIQSLLYKALKWEPPETVNFGLVYLPGEKLHKRDIIEGFRKKSYTGWNDIKLPTIQALVRRGFHPDTFRESAIMCGLSKTDIRLDWENIEGINRKVIDPLANRYMVVIDPVKIEIDTTGDVKSVETPLHPDFPDRGDKKIPVSDFIYISRDDFERLSGKEFRLKNLFNIDLKGRVGHYSGNEVKKEHQKVQWVSEPHVKVKILTKENVLQGLGEPAMQQLKVGDIIQMERIGFGRVDKKEKEGIVIAFAHK